MFKKIIVILLTLSTLSCVGNNQNKISKEDVLNYMDEYFEKVKQNDFNSLQLYYSDEFYKTTKKEAWLGMLETIHSGAGALLSVELETWGVKTMLSTGGSGTTYTLIYKNVYENAGVKETITIYKPRGSRDIGIIGHEFNSSVLPEVLPEKEENVPVVYIEKSRSLS